MVLPPEVMVEDDAISSSLGPKVLGVASPVPSAPTAVTTVPKWVVGSKWGMPMTVTPRDLRVGGAGEAAPSLITGGEGWPGDDPGAALGAVVAGPEFAVAADPVAVAVAAALLMVVGSGMSGC